MRATSLLSFTLVFPAALAFPIYYQVSDPTHHAPSHPGNVDLSPPSSVTPPATTTQSVSKVHFVSAPPSPPSRKPSLYEQWIHTGPDDRQMVFAAPAKPREALVCTSGNCRERDATTKDRKCLAKCKEARQRKRDLAKRTPEPIEFEHNGGGGASLGPAGGKVINGTLVPNPSNTTTRLSSWGQDSGSRSNLTALATQSQLSGNGTVALGNVPEDGSHLGKRQSDVGSGDDEGDDSEDPNANIESSKKSSSKYHNKGGYSSGSGKGGSSSGQHKGDDYSHGKPTGKGYEHGNYGNSNSGKNKSGGGHYSSGKSGHSSPSTSPKAKQPSSSSKGKSSSPPPASPAKSSLNTPTKGKSVAPTVPDAGKPSPAPAATTGIKDKTAKPLTSAVPMPSAPSSGTSNPAAPIAVPAPAPAPQQPAPLSGSLAQDCANLQSIYSSMGGSTWLVQYGWDGQSKSEDPKHTLSMAVTQSSMTTAAPTIQQPSTAATVLTELPTTAAPIVTSAQATSAITEQPTVALTTAVTSAVTSAITDAAPSDLDAQVFQHAPTGSRNSRSRSFSFIRHPASGDGMRKVLYARGDYQGSTTTCCAWYGVTCSSVTGRVQALDLGGNGLTGPMDKGVFGLSGLVRLNMSDNAITAVPNQFDSLPRLSSLSLSSIALAAPTDLPLTIPSLPTLNTLNLADNLFAGSATLLSPELQNVNLQGNQIQSVAFSGGVAGLERVDLKGNEIRGPLPDLSAATGLLTFDGSSNNFTGDLFDMSRLGSLTTLDIRSNSLTGGLPSTFNYNPQLTTFLIGSNDFEGTLPLEEASPVLTNCEAQPNPGLTCPSDAQLADPNSIGSRCNAGCGENPETEGLKADATREESNSYVTSGAEEAFAVSVAVFLCAGACLVFSFFR